MSTTYKVLESDTDFLTAAIAQIRVSVWYWEDPANQVGQLIDYGGIVQGYSPDSIKIADGRFIRERFEFRAHIK